MNEMNKSWVVPTLTKHSRDSIIILTELVDAGLRNGFCTANDIQHLPPTRNVIGSVFKILRNVGFRKTGETVTAERKDRHGGTIFKWTLLEHFKAEAFSERCRNRLLELRPEKEQDQLRLAM